MAAKDAQNAHTDNHELSLFEWMVLYVKHKDVIARKLKETKEDVAHNTAAFTFKDSVMQARAQEKLNPAALHDAGNAKTLVTTLHTKENVDTLIKQWSTFSSHRGLTIVFVNLKKNEKWMIHPYTHAQISENKVEAGIRSMADCVTYM